MLTQIFGGDRFAEALMRLFAEHFRHNKNKNRAAESAAKQQIEQRITGGGKHGSEDECNHIDSFRVVFGYMNLNRNAVFVIWGNLLGA
jgi:hypothetical protein